MECSVECGLFRKAGIRNWSGYRKKSMRMMDRSNGTGWVRKRAACLNWRYRGRCFLGSSLADRISWICAFVPSSLQSVIRPKVWNQSIMSRSRYCIACSTGDYLHLHRTCECMPIANIWCTERSFIAISPYFPQTTMPLKNSVRPLHPSSVYHFISWGLSPLRREKLVAR